jgi:L-fuculose-phosphate aldolase
MLKSKIIEVGRELIRSGLVAGTWGNISTWDSSRNGYWITPSGMDYLSLNEEDLVLLDLENNIIEGNRRPSSEYLLHSAIYRNRSEVQGIVHTHSVFATAHAVSRVPLPGLVEDLVMITGGEVEIAEYHLAGTMELASATVKALGNKNAVFLANHGLAGVGQSLDEALKVCQVVEKSAQIHVMSRLLGTPIVLSNKDIQLMHKNYVNFYGQK